MYLDNLWEWSDFSIQLWPTVGICNTSSFSFSILNKHSLSYPGSHVCLCQRFFTGKAVHCSLSPPLSSISRCIRESVVPAGDHLWSGPIQRLPLCFMEVMLGATEWPFPPRCPQGGALPGGRPTARPHRGKKKRGSHSKAEVLLWATFSFLDYLFCLHLNWAHLKCLFFCI